MNSMWKCGSDCRPASEDLKAVAQLENIIPGVVVVAIDVVVVYAGVVAVVVVRAAKHDEQYFTSK